MSALDTTTAELHQAAFGNRDLLAGAGPGDAASIAISARDAGDRVDQLATPQDALALLERANGTGDEVLARAIGQRAHSMGEPWDPVLAAYIADRPKQGRAVNQLRLAAGVSISPAAVTAMRATSPGPADGGNL